MTVPPERDGFLQTYEGACAAQKASRRRSECPSQQLRQKTIQSFPHWQLTCERPIGYSELASNCPGSYQIKPDIADDAGGAGGNRTHA